MRAERGGDEGPSKGRAEWKDGRGDEAPSNRHVRVRCDRGYAPVCWSACACACTVPRGSLRLRKSAAALPHHLVTQTKRGVSLNFPDQVTSERRFGATLQPNCPYARCSTSELMTWQKKSRGLQSKLRKTENIALVRANRERRLLGSLFAHSSTLGEVSSSSSAVVTLRRRR